MFIQAIPDLQVVLERLNKLEQAQKASVDSSLADIRQMASSKASTFNKDHLMDLLLGLKLVARETRHPKAGYYSAVLEAMRERFQSPPDQFKKYILVLLGDKDHEKVLDSLAKVDKAYQVSSPSANRGVSTRGRGRGGRFANVQCYHCFGFGHYKSHCPLLAQSVSNDGKPPSPKRGKWSNTPL